MRQQIVEAEDCVEFEPSIQGLTHHLRTGWSVVFRGGQQQVLSKRTVPQRTAPKRTVSTDLFDHGAKLSGVPDAAWYADSIPFLNLPNQGRQIEDLYYYRWQVTREQTKYVGTKNKWVDGVFINGKGKMGPNSNLDLRWMRERHRRERRCSTRNGCRTALHRPDRGQVRRSHR